MRSKIMNRTRKGTGYVWAENIRVRVRRGGRSFILALAGGCLFAGACKSAAVISPTSATTLDPGDYIVQVGTSTHMIYQSTAAINEVFAYGFADGMNYERADDLNILSAVLASTGTIMDAITQINGKNYADPGEVPGFL